MIENQANSILDQRSANMAETEGFGAVRSTVVLPELLAPAGDWECAKAAVENGADAIYFGLERFNARMRARNFAVADLPKLMDFLHRRGVKGYVTFNTLVFANEFAEAEQYLRSIIVAGVDAAIVQDVGICRLIRKLSPDFPIHASTQMTITSAGGVEFARDLGCNLVVLARECSLQEIEKIQAAQQESESLVHPSLPLEVFVHGALCVAYSGQCLTSEALGGRSANRGECAQACRMPYDLIADGKAVFLGDRRYLLSPQDLAGLEVLPELISAGVASLKIEGRLKTAEYVANITRAYRRALDRVSHALNERVMSAQASSPAISEGEPDGTKNSGPRESSITSASGKLAHSTSAKSDPEDALIKSIRAESRYNLEMGFSRGLSTGWFRGINNQELVHARFGKKRGVFLGEVSEIQGETVLVKLLGPLKPGDGVVFDAGHPDQDEEGGRVYGSRKQGEYTALNFGSDSVDFKRIHAGDKLWKTSDPQLDRQLRQTFAGVQPRFQRPLNIEAHGRLGQSLIVIARDEFGHVARASSTMLLTRPEKHPLTTDRLREQLGRLGGTQFFLAELKNCLEGQLLLPVSELNRLRRELIHELDALRARPKRWTLTEGTNSASSLETVEKKLLKATSHDSPEKPEAHVEMEIGPDKALPDLIVLVRNLAQLEMALECGAQTLYCEFEDPKKYRQAVIRFREWEQQMPRSERSVELGPGNSKREIFVAPPRIFKMGEEWILKQVRSCDADGYLVRNYDHLDFFADCRRIGDFSLNVANPMTADYFKSHFGLERVTASYDLNIVQLEALLRSAPPEWFEITIHQHMPMFHMEHCVFCAFLSQGTDYTNCGRPCDRHQVELRDRVGAEHPLKADAGCRNTVFNARAQTGAEFISRMIGLGARYFRAEFLNETPDQVAQTIAKYRQLLHGQITGRQLWRELQLINQLGVTRGQIERAEG